MIQSAHNALQCLLADFRLTFKKELHIGQQPFEVVNYEIKTYRMDPLSNPNFKDGPIIKSRFKGWNQYGNPFSGYGLTMKPQNGASSGTLFFAPARPLIQERIAHRAPGSHIV